MLPVERERISVGDLVWITNGDPPMFAQEAFKICGIATNIDHGSSGPWYRVAYTYSGRNYFSLFPENMIHKVEIINEKRDL